MPSLRNGDAEIYYEESFGVTRDDVAHCSVPLIAMPGDDGPHPTAIGEEIARVATDFLLRHTP